MGSVWSSEKTVDVEQCISWVPTGSVDTSCSKIVHVSVTSSYELTQNMLIDDIRRLGPVVNVDQLQKIKSFVRLEDDIYLRLPQVHIINKSCESLITIVNDHTNVEQPSSDTVYTLTV